MQIGVLPSESGKSVGQSAIFFTTIHLVASHLASSTNWNSSRSTCGLVYLAGSFFLLFPFASARFGANFGLGVLGVGVFLAYLFAMWGKEFEAQ
jgi:hypothetical protein